MNYGCDEETIGLWITSFKIFGFATSQLLHILEQCVPSLNYRFLIEIKRSLLKVFKFLFILRILEFFLFQESSLPLYFYYHFYIIDLKFHGFLFSDFSLGHCRHALNAGFVLGIH